MTTAPEPTSPMATEPRPTCLMCGGPGGVAHREMTDRLYQVPGRWDIRRCADPACGLGWLDPMPIEADIGKAYAHYYTHEAWDEAAPATPVAPRALLRNFVFKTLTAPYVAFVHLSGVVAERARMHLMWLDGVPPGRLLEVGCGSGFHMVWLAARGWQVEGQDVDAQAAAALTASKGFQVHVGPLPALQLPAASYDAIVLNHVLEHVHRPAELLSELHRLLKPGGRLVLAVPNFDSYGHTQVFGANWVGLDAPRHLYHFRRGHLERLALAAGFSRVSVRSSSGNAELIGSMSLQIATGAPHSLKLDLAAKWYQVKSWLAHARAPERGEELVLEAEA